MAENGDPPVQIVAQPEALPDIEALRQKLEIMQQIQALGAQIGLTAGIPQRPAVQVKNVKVPKEDITCQYQSIVLM